jgi:hypothetical protein
MTPVTTSLTTLLGIAGMMVFMAWTLGVLWSWGFGIFGVAFLLWGLFRNLFPRRRRALTALREGGAALVAFHREHLEERIRRLRTQADRNVIIIWYIVGGIVLGLAIVQVVAVGNPLGSPWSPVPVLLAVLTLQQMWDAHVLLPRLERERASLGD